MHPGGRSVLDAVERALKLDPRALEGSREVLRRYGNMSSPTILFVLAAMKSGAPGRGCAGIRPRPLDREHAVRGARVIALRVRSRAPELMDTERVDLATFEACLKDLEWINRWTGAYRVTLGWLERLRKTHDVRRLCLVDIGSGYGDMLRRIAAWRRAASPSISRGSI